MFIGRAISRSVSPLPTRSRWNIRAMITMTASFAMSAVCTLTGPIGSHRCAPLTTFPNTSVATNSKIEPMKIGSESTSKFR
jgi:hypothetical protein